MYLQSEDEIPVSAIPQMTLTSLSDTPIPQFPRLNGKAWIFSGLPIGTSYELDVKVDGFQPFHETVDIPDMEYGTANVVVTLRPIDEQLTYHPPTGQFMLAPRVQKEVQQGLRDLKLEQDSFGAETLSKSDCDGSRQSLRELRDGHELRPCQAGGEGPALLGGVCLARSE
ncbi:MAG: hypothetical protein WAN10_00335 [Candidatus Acidiferrales bacterium]